MTSCSSPGIARQARIRRSSVRLIPAPNSGWRRNISSKIATARTQGAAFNIGTTSVSNTLANGSGRRRPRTPFFCDGSLRSFSKRYAVKVLNDALAAATGGVSV